MRRQTEITTNLAYNIHTNTHSLSFTRTHARMHAHTRTQLLFYERSLTQLSAYSYPLLLHFPLGGSCKKEPHTTEVSQERHEPSSPPSFVSLSLARRPPQRPPRAHRSSAASFSPQPSDPGTLGIPQVVRSKQRYLSSGSLAPSPVRAAPNRHRTNTCN